MNVASISMMHSSDSFISTLLAIIFRGVFVIDGNMVAIAIDDR